MRIVMFGRIRNEFQYLEGWDKNSNVWKNKRRILIFGRIAKENNKIRIPMFRRIK